MPPKPWRAFGRYFVLHIIVIDPSITIKNIKIILRKLFVLFTINIVHFGWTILYTQQIAL